MKQTERTAIVLRYANCRDNDRMLTLFCTVVLNNEKINSPSNPKRREVGDCIYFATLIPNE